MSGNSQRRVSGIPAGLIFPQAPQLISLYQDGLASHSFIFPASIIPVPVAGNTSLLAAPPQRSIFPKEAQLFVTMTVFVGSPSPAMNPFFQFQAAVHDRDFFMPTFHASILAQTKPPTNGRGGGRISATISR